MGISSSTQQHKNTFSANRTKVQNMICYNDNLTDEDIRVALVLMTILEGYDLQPTENETVTDGRIDIRRKNDPKIYKHIDASVIADRLGWKTKKVKKSIKHLMNEDILEEDESETSGIKHGLRFMF